MDFAFWGSGKHKISPSAHLSEANSGFLDVRSVEKYEPLAFGLIHHMEVLHIPIHEIPDRISEIPHDKNVGVFCSSGVRSTMVYLYPRASGFDNVRIDEGGYAVIIEELKPGKLLKRITGKGAAK